MHTLATGFIGRGFFVLQLALLGAALLSVILGGVIAYLARARRERRRRPQEGIWLAPLLCLVPSLYVAGLAADEGLGWAGLLTLLLAGAVSAAMGAPLGAVLGGVVSRRKARHVLAKLAIEREQRRRRAQELLSEDLRAEDLRAGERATPPPAP
ncbi:MAG: hypothetical protein AB7N76_36995 [Planctomycetota bacterium]